MLPLPLAVRVLPLYIGFVNVSVVGVVGCELLMVAFASFSLVEFASPSPALVLTLMMLCASLACII